MGHPQLEWVFVWNSIERERCATRRVSQTDNLLALPQIFRQALPVVRLPPCVEVSKIAFVEAPVVKDNFGFGTVRFKFKLH